MEQDEAGTLAALKERLLRHWYRRAHRLMGVLLEL